MKDGRTRRQLYILCIYIHVFTNAHEKKLNYFNKTDFDDENLNIPNKKLPFKMHFNLVKIQNGNKMYYMLKKKNLSLRIYFLAEEIFENFSFAQLFQIEK